jgi:hypothetical protein
MQSCEVLDYCSNETGLRAAALRDKNTKEITLVIAGGDFSQKDQKLSQDIDDVWASTKGKLGDQFPEVYKFAKNVEAKFGKIDLITGHSLGGNNTLNLAYGFPDAKKIAFDCTGLQFSSEKRLSDFYTEKCGHDVSIADIRNATKDVIRIKPGKDVYNALGSVGIDLTMVEPSKDNYSALTNTGTFMQNQHLYGKVFFKNMSDDNLKLYQDKSKGGYSGTPIELSLVFLAALATCAYKNRKRFSSWASKVKSGKNPEPVHGAEIS